MLGEEVQRHIGCGFNEVIFQNALAIEFRKRKIEYLKEVNIEIFYKGESVGVDRPDFILTKIDEYKEPILLELKVSDKIADGHRIQLKSYCISLPKNNNPVLTDFAGGILMSFPTCDIDSCARVKIFVVDPKFNVLIDEQQEEERMLEEQRLKEQERKKQEKEKEKKGKKEVK
ncbi:MAG: GxxExxY protein [Candidatus Omnitrophica bacterium]|nr:GxxExxY protein [Candidatus Omnitrophota bacterium]